MKPRPSLSEGSAFRLGLFDVRDHLPDAWSHDILEVAQRGRQVDSPGLDVALPGVAQKALRYRVTDGFEIRDRLPWLWELYKSIFCDIASEIAGESLVTARDHESAVNLNYLSGEEASYEWHVDTNTVTGLLFVTSHATGEGGELRFRKEECGLDASVSPVAGWFAAFDARTTPHTIEALTDFASERVTVPMNFFGIADDQERSPSVSDHVYGRNSEDPS